MQCAGVHPGKRGLLRICAGVRLPEAACCAVPVRNAICNNDSAEQSSDEPRESEMLISKKLNAAVNEQVGHEFAAMLQYVAIATYFDGEALPRLAAHFYRQAEEERQHGMRLV